MEIKKQKSKDITPVVENCNWLESNILELDCTISRDTIVSTLDAVNDFLKESFMTLQDEIQKPPVVQDSDQVVPDDSVVVLTMEEKIEKYLLKMRESTIDFLSAFLDERLTLDRLSLMSFKKSMLEKVIRCRENSFEFQQKYDIAARHREEQTIRQTVEESKGNLANNLQIMTKEVERKDHENALLNRQLEYLMYQHDILEAKHRDLKLSAQSHRKKTMRGKKNKKGKKHPPGHSGHNNGHHKHGHGTHDIGATSDSGMESPTKCMKCIVLEEELRSVRENMRGKVEELISLKLSLGMMQPGETSPSPTEGGDQKHSSHSHHHRHHGKHHTRSPTLSGHASAASSPTNTEAVNSAAAPKVSDSAHHSTISPDNVQSPAHSPTDGHHGHSHHHSRHSHHHHHHHHHKDKSSSPQHIEEKSDQIIQDRKLDEGIVVERQVGNATTTVSAAVPPPGSDTISTSTSAALDSSNPNNSQPAISRVPSNGNGNSGIKVASTIAKKVSDPLVSTEAVSAAPSAVPLTVSVDTSSAHGAQVSAASVPNTPLPTLIKPDEEVKKNSAGHKKVKSSSGTGTVGEKSKKPIGGDQGSPSKQSPAQQPQPPQNSNDGIVEEKNAIDNNIENILPVPEDSRVVVAEPIAAGRRHSGSTIRRHSSSSVAAAIAAATVSNATTATTAAADIAPSQNIAIIGMSLETTQAPLSQTLAGAVVEAAASAPVDSKVTGKLQAKDIGVKNAPVASSDSNRVKRNSSSNVEKDKDKDKSNAGNEKETVAVAPVDISTFRGNAGKDDIGSQASNQKPGKTIVEKKTSDGTEKISKVLNSAAVRDESKIPSPAVSPRVSNSSNASINSITVRSINVSSGHVVTETSMAQQQQQQQQQQQPLVENVSNQPNRRRSSSDASSVSAASSYISNNSMVEPVERKPRRKSKTKKGQKPVAYIGLNSDDEGDAESEYSQYSNSVSESVANSGGSFSIVNRENIYRDQLLIEAQEVQQELQTRILSLEYQNSKLSKKLRSEEAQAEKQETLYKLQIQERDLLLRVLTDQVKDLRLVISKQEMISKISAPPQIPVRDNSVQRYRTGEYQTSKNQPFPLPNIKWDVSEDFARSALSSREGGGRSKTSFSMPDLNGSASPVKDPGFNSALAGSLTNRIAETSSLPRPFTSLIQKHGTLADGEVSSERFRARTSDGGMQLQMNSPTPVEEDYLEKTEANAEALRLAEIKDVRKQIAAALATQNASQQEKKPTQFACSKLADAKRKGREMTVRPN